MDKLDEYLKSLDFKECGKDFVPKVGMVIECKDWIPHTLKDRSPSFSYYLVGDALFRPSESRDESDYVGDGGCGCCEETLEPVRYAWISEEVREVQS